MIRYGYLVSTQEQYSRRKISCYEPEATHFMILISLVSGTCSILDTGCPEKEAERLREKETKWARERK